MADHDTPPAPGGTLPTRIPPTFWLRIAWAGLLPLAVTLWLTVPALQPQAVLLSGRAEAGEACLLKCAPALRVAGQLLACKADLLGVPYPCAPRLLQAGEVQVSYVPLPSLAAMLGLSPTVGVLTRLERDGEHAYRRSVSSLVWSTLYGGWVFNAIYWGIAGIVIWRWPRSRFSRRATWAAPDR